MIRQFAWMAAVWGFVYAEINALNIHDVAPRVVAAVAVGCMLICCYIMWFKEDARRDDD